MSKVFYHRCGIGMDKGIIEFYTDQDGNTTARCRNCGKDITHQVVIDETLMGIFDLEATP